MLAEHLWTGRDGFDEAWNIGPDPSENRQVLDVAQAMVRALGQGRIEITPDSGAPHEAKLLALDCSKARARLGWTPRLDFAATVAMTADWYGAWLRGEDVVALTRAQIAMMGTRAA
jgi:CDP-glucose 4,6-dehydratase